MDKREAKIITTENGGQLLKVVSSDVEEFKSKGGSGTRLKGGPQDVVHDSKYLEREKHQYRNYFSEVIKQIPDFHRLVIFGPAQTGQKFFEEIKNNFKYLKPDKMEVKTADSMTDNQMIAWVRDYYR
ncbi:MAG TPA: hypothetical protein DDY13_19265 [Cytophagales bacterium]|nr:hypothetical protein [Cytophagales bacterium]